MIALYTVVDTMGVQRAQNVTSYSAWIFTGYLLMPLVLRLLRFQIRIVDASSLPRATGAGILSLAAYTIVLWATHYTDVDIVSALRETSVLWAIVMGHFFLGERFTLRRTASAGLICCGIALLVSTAR